jgi:hypothetical protein
MNHSIRNYQMLRTARSNTAQPVPIGLSTLDDGAAATGEIEVAGDDWRRAEVGVESSRSELVSRSISGNGETKARAG